jgi:para-nitrobenzyl esterase
MMKQMMIMVRTSIRTRQHHLLGLMLALSVTLSACTTPVIAAGKLEEPTLVETNAGSVQGKLIDDYRVFLGIPYAAPPVGKLRWQPPPPVEAWSEPLDASEATPACMQGLVDASDSEDCLYLHVTTPRARSASGLRPVMVWIMGEGSPSAGEVNITRTGWPHWVMSWS